MKKYALAVATACLIFQAPNLAHGQKPASQPTEEAQHVKAKIWFASLSLPEREKAVSRITKVRDNLIKLHELTKNFSAEKHEQVRVFEQKLRASAALPDDGEAEVIRAAYLLLTISRARAELNTHEESIMYASFIDYIR